MIVGKLVNAWHFQNCKVVSTGLHGGTPQYTTIWRTNWICKGICCQLLRSCGVGDRKMKYEYGALYNNDGGMGELMYLEKTLSNCHSAHHKSHT